MPGILLSDAIEVFQRQLGCGGEGERKRLIDTIQAALEWNLLNGGGSILREWKVIARNGRFVLPPDLDTPIKYKFARSPNFGFGTVNSPYFSYGSQGVTSCCGYNDWNPRLEVTANKVPTQYAPPKEGIRPLATTRDERDVGKQLMIAGLHCGKVVSLTLIN